MSVFHIPFPLAFASVSSTDGTVTLRELPSRDQEAEKTYEAEAYEAIRAISGTLNQLESSVQSAIALFQDQVTLQAINIARAVLNADDPQIQQRAKAFIETALSQVNPHLSPTVYVHPVCHLPITQWMSGQGDDAIPIKEDPAILPGDCRIEWGQNGIEATLDSCLAAISDHLASASVTP